MKERRTFTGAIWVANVVVVLCLVGVLAYFLLGRGEVAGPMVTIHSPNQGERVRVGKMVTVHSTSRDEEHNVVRVELWVDGNRVEVDVSPQGGLALSVAQGWQPLLPGDYTLVVRAFNDAHVDGQATIRLQVVASQDEVGEGPPPEEEPSMGISPEDSIMPPPGGFPSDEDLLPEDTPPEDTPSLWLPVFPDPRVPPVDLIDGLFEVIISGMVGDQLPDPPTTVALRLLDLEVMEDYDKVYCYVSLDEGPMERMPQDEDSFLDPGGERHWNIAEHMNGESGVLIPIPAGEPLKLFAECYGWSGDQLHYLGRIDVVHPSEEWDGRILRAEAIGGEGFGADYAIMDDPDLGPFPPPFGLQRVRIGDRDYLHWGWSGDAEEIDGFKIYRNGALVGVIPNDRIYPLSLGPPCNEEDEYHVTAYQGVAGPEQLESLSSSILPITGPPCAEVDDIGVPQVVENLCSGSGVIIEVPYTYMSDHGEEVYVGAWAVGGDGTLAAAGHVRVEHGSGRALIELVNLSTDVLRTDQLRLHFMDREGWYFYTEKSDQVLSWAEPLPDLEITEASVTGALAEVRVKNTGCASVDGFNLLVDLQDAMDIFYIDTHLVPGQTYVWTFVSEMFGLGYRALVDPADEIAELDEENNAYEVGPITLSRVHIYKIAIHSTSEGWPEDTDQGEFFFDIIVGDKWTARPRVNGGRWVLPVGEFEIDGVLEPILLSPSLDWNEDLYIQFAGFEYDGFLGDTDSVGIVKFTHSHNVFEEGSWKAGGEFSAPSSTGEFTIYWRLELE